MIINRQKRKVLSAQPTPDTVARSFPDYRFTVDTTTVPIPIHPLSPLSTITTAADQPNTPKDHEPTWVVSSYYHTMATAEASRPLAIPLPPLSSSSSQPRSAGKPTHLMAAAAATYPPPFPFTNEPETSSSSFTVGSIENDKPPVPWPDQMKDLKTPSNEDWPTTTPPASEEELLLFQMDDWKL